MEHGLCSALHCTARRATSCGLPALHACRQQLCADMVDLTSAARQVAGTSQTHSSVLSGAGFQRGLLLH